MPSPLLLSPQRNLEQAHWSPSYPSIGQLSSQSTQSTRTGATWRQRSAPLSICRLSGLLTISVGWIPLNSKVRHGDGSLPLPGTRFGSLDQQLLAIFRSDANGCSVALCQRRQPPKAGAVGQRLQRVSGQPSLIIKSDGWFPAAAGPTDPRAALCEDDLDSGTDSAPFMRGFSPPPTPGTNPCRRPN